MIVNRQPLYMQIVNELESRVENGLYEDGARLASEPDLAEEFGVSRGTLREALGILEKDGYLIREHGKGSFIRTKNKVFAGIERLEALTETIRNAGYEAEDEVLEIREEELSKSECKMLDLEPKTRGFVVESLRKANGVPVIYCYDVIPAYVVNDSLKKMQQRAEFECMTEFLKNATEYTPSEYDSTLTAVLAEAPLTDLLQVKENAPLIKMSGVILAYNGRPINYGVQYFNGDAYQFRLVRK
ncbi:GntR family transcriptional regulator [Clostridia bacterium]|nr:GntR family transcriptional regulator [Clostridia bacterium]